MKIYRSLEEIPRIYNAIVTQGTFDGVHAAHQVIIDRLKAVAARTGGETVLLTFHPHPRFVLNPDNHGMKLLQTLDEKIEALDQMGIDHLVIIPFTKEFSRLSSEDFVSSVIVDRIGAHYLVIGYNHRFGKNREGDHDQLQTYARRFGFEVEEIPEQDIDAIAVSSTKIRNALAEGQIATANRLLLKPFRLRGEVIKGKQLGRTIGFPTANIQIKDADKLIPGDGVYAVKVILHNKVYGGMLNSGYRPTVNGTTHSIEVHLFDFDEQIYGEILCIEYVDKLRDEIKFNSVTELQKQLESDKLHAQTKLDQAS